MEFRNYRFGVHGAAGRKAEFELYLPPTSAHQRIRALAEQGNFRATTPEGVVRRRVDDQVRGTVAVFHPDERLGARSGKPQMVYSHLPGGRPVLQMNTGGKRVEELVERAQEMRHYGEDIPEIPYRPTAEQVQEAWLELHRALQDRQVGRQRFYLMSGKGGRR